MGTAVLVTRLALAAVLALAALTKLTDRDGFRRSVASLELPPPLARALTILVPGSELVLALLLIPAATAWAAALAALALILAFTSTLLQARARGLDPDCGCFGQLGADVPFGATLARNALLAAAAAFVAIAGFFETAP